MSSPAKLSLRVYVAGPFSGPRDEDVLKNVSRAVAVGEALRSAGHTPFIPHLSYFWAKDHPFSYEEAMRWCFVWLAQCEALVKFAPSPGADREFVYAKEMGIPVFSSVAEFFKHVDVREKYLELYGRHPAPKRPPISALTLPGEDSPKVGK